MIDMRNRKRWFLPTLLIVLVLVLAACGDDDDDNGNDNPPADTVETPEATQPTSPAAAGVVMVNTAFEPQQIEVPAGTTITWTNQDSESHTVTAGPRDAPSGLFDSGEIAGGGTFSFTFTEPGTYEYHCTPHEGMDGTVVVTAPEG
jgi:plastocyanin